LSNEIQIGQLLDGRFEITALIQRTRMAATFKALDHETRLMVILKAPQTDLGISPKTSARFAREAAIIAGLDHPGIPKVISIPEKSRPYIVMEYLDGETLFDILERTGPLPECHALRLASRLCDILDYMHGHGVIHHDLKPGNIMIAADGIPCLIDFGIATGPSIQPLMFSLFSEKIGTPEYMSPEQVQGDRMDARTDIYSLGAVLYEMVTGTRPFQGETDDEVLEAHLAGDPRPPREITLCLSEQTEEIILHALAPRPSDRYPSAGAMKADLDAPKNVRVTGLAREHRKANLWPKRFRMAGFVLAVASLPFILFFVFLLILPHSRPLR
jgi:eukaryotic-like serine/threonine-protein kinase